MKEVMKATTALQQIKSRESLPNTVMCSEPGSRHFHDYLKEHVVNISLPHLWNCRGLEEQTLFFFFLIFYFILLITAFKICFKKENFQLLTSVTVLTVQELTQGKPTFFF